MANHLKHSLCLLLLVLLSPLGLAAVLPEDRADVMYHRYDGGGVTIDGPSVLVRKDIAGKVSISANHYVDNVSSASIDVEASGASEYEEERTEKSFGLDFLQDKAILSIGVTNSEENDYEAKTVFLGISQDFFGDLTTVTLGYARGDDIVMQNGNDDFEDEVERQNFRFGVSQIITSSLLLSLNYEAITDEGYLNNPYRSYRYRNPLDPDSYITETEVYPRTRTSDAAALGAKYYLPYRAAIGFNYRYYKDDWDIKGKTMTLEYTHPVGENWIIDVTLRTYEQQAAKFYSDLHDAASIDDTDFRARDKELSEYTTQTLGIGISYELKFSPNALIKKGSVTLNYDSIQFDYDNFRDLTKGNGIAGEEPLYTFDAEVIRFFVSIWY